MSTTRIASHGRFAWAAARRLQLTRRAMWARLPSSADRARAHLVVLALWLRVATSIPIPVPVLHLTVAGEPRRLRFASEAEFFGIYEVFATDDYAIELMHPVRRVLDIGANVGLASLLLAERYPEAEIIAVEPAPDTFAVLRANLRSLPQVTPLNLALGADEPVMFDLGAPSTERQSTAAGVTVRGQRLTSLLAELGWDGVDLIKIDAEGAEFAVFADPAMGLVRAAVGEVHHRQAPESFTTVAALLPEFTVRCAPAVSGDATMFQACRT